MSIYQYRSETLIKCLQMLFTFYYATVSAELSYNFGSCGRNEYSSMLMTLTKRIGQMRKTCHIICYE